MTNLNLPTPGPRHLTLHVMAIRASLHYVLSALVLASALAGARSQLTPTCGATSTTAGDTIFRVANTTDAEALGAAVSCADGGTVQAVWAGMVTLDSPISVGSGTFLSITGGDSLAEVQGGSRTRLFAVSPSGSLALKQLKLSGGSAPSGGAIHATSAAVTLDGCVLDGNDATAGDGGAVWAKGGELTVVGGEFSDNSATGNGGAVLAVDAKVVIQDGTVFEENRATLEGGALYCGGAENSTAAAGDAAAPSCSLSKAVFTSNLATSQEDLGLSFIEGWSDLYGGGAAAFYRCAVNVTDSIFELNYAQVAGGGVFAGSDTDMTIDGCTFQNNTTPGYGAGVVAATATLGGGTLVTANEAGESGGGVSGSRVIVGNLFVFLSNVCVFSTRTVPNYKQKALLVVENCYSVVHRRGSRVCCVGRFLLDCRFIFTSKQKTEKT